MICDRLFGLCGGAVEYQDRPGLSFWMGNRLADWKVVSRFDNMGRLLLLGTYPSGAQMRNLDYHCGGSQ